MSGTRPAPSLQALVRSFLKFGAIGFGGPIALAGTTAITGREWVLLILGAGTLGLVPFRG